MSLYKSSRYADEQSRDIMMVYGVDQRRTVTRRPPTKELPRGGFHVWRAGDRIDRVAQWALGDPAKWWRILDVNPEIVDASNIPPGTHVRLP